MVAVSEHGVARDIRGRVLSVGDMISFDDKDVRPDATVVAIDPSAPKYPKVVVRCNRRRPNGETMEIRLSADTVTLVTGTNHPDALNILGVPAGLTVFHVQAMVSTESRDGYPGSFGLPTFFVVGGLLGDAVNNAARVVQALGTGGLFGGDGERRAVSFLLTVSTADPSAPHESIAREFDCGR